MAKPSRPLAGASLAPALVAFATCLSSVAPSVEGVHQFKYENCGLPELKQARREASGYAVDMVAKVDRTSEYELVSSGGHRTLYLFAGELGDAYLKLVEYGYMQICLLSLCSACGQEGIVTSSLLESYNIGPRIVNIVSLLDRFAEVLESGLYLEEFAEQYRKLPGDWEEEVQLNKNHKKVLEKSKNVLEAIKNGLDPLSDEDNIATLDLEFVQRVSGAEINNRILAEFIDKFRSVSMTARNTILVALSEIPRLATSGHPLPGLDLPWGLVSWEDMLNLEQFSRSGLIGVYQNLRHSRRLFTRSSKLCDASMFADAFPIVEKPYRDPSGMYTWHGAPVNKLLEIIENSGRPLAKSVWRVLSTRHYQMPVQPGSTCNAGESGIKFDPTDCLLDQGFGVATYHVNFDLVDEESTALHVRYDPRAWNNHRPLEGRTWRGELEGRVVAPPEMNDVFFVSPVACNCVIAEILLTAESMTAAKLVYMPINPAIPPPLEVTPNFTKMYEHIDESQDMFEQETRYILAQCSLARVVKMMKNLGYILLFVEHIYAIFAHHTVGPSFIDFLPSFAKAQETEERRKQRKKRRKAISSDAMSFDAWRRGWFCSVLSRYEYSLEAHSGFELTWLSPTFVLGSESFCRFLVLYTYINETEIIRRYRCHDIRAKENADPTPMLEQKARVLKASSTPNTQLALPSQATPYELLGEGHRGHRWANKQRFICHAGSCSCVPPYRGSLCLEKDAGPMEEKRRFSGSVLMLIPKLEAQSPGRTLDDLQDSLRLFWDHFNIRHDYPLLIFYVSLSPLERETLAACSPTKIWYFAVQSEEPHKDFDEGAVMEHFRDHGLFYHPALRQLDVAWFLGLDRKLVKPLLEDPLRSLSEEKAPAIFLGDLEPWPASQPGQKLLWELVSLYLQGRGKRVGSLADAATKAFSQTFLESFFKGGRWSGNLLSGDSMIVRVRDFGGSQSAYKSFQSFAKSQLSASSSKVSLSEVYSTSLLHTLGLLTLALLPSSEGGTRPQLLPFPPSLQDALRDG